MIGLEEYCCPECGNTKTRKEIINMLSPLEIYDIDTDTTQTIFDSAVKDLFKHNSPYIHCSKCNQDRQWKLKTQR